MATPWSDTVLFAIMILEIVSQVLLLVLAFRLASVVREVAAAAHTTTRAFENSRILTLEHLIENLATEASKERAKYAAESRPPAAPWKPS